MPWQGLGFSLLRIGEGTVTNNGGGGTGGAVAFAAPTPQPYFCSPRQKWHEGARVPPHIWVVDSYHAASKTPITPP